MSTQNDVGSKLYSIRIERGETQEQVADSVGISYVSLSRYETGQRMPKMDILIRLADHYGVTVDSIVGRKMNEPEPSPRISLVARGMEGMSDEEQERFLAMARAAFPAVFGDK